MLRPSLLLLATTALLHAESCACTIPVFRYALDRWEADPFHLLLPVTASQDRALTDALRPLRANGKANLDITTRQEATPAEAVLNFSRESDQPLWQGRLDAAMLAQVLDSPARTQMVERILAGDSAIWVIAMQDTAEDRAQAERIEKRLRFLQQVAALPIQDPNDPDSQLGPGPALKLQFTTLRLRRDDPAENLLLKMLAGPQQTVNPSTTSFAAAIFGKGRVLGAWALQDLDDAALEDTSMFLVGRCSCRLKNQNPGWDLLLNVDWESALQKAGESRQQAPAVVTAAPPAKPETVVTQAASADITATTSSSPAMSSSRPLAPWLLLAAGALIVAAFWLLRGGSKSA